MLLVLSVIGGIAIAASVSDPLFGIGLGFIAAIQCMVLVGFGRLIQSNHRTALLQQRTVDLLERAVNQSEQP